MRARLPEVSRAEVARDLRRLMWWTLPLFLAVHVLPLRPGADGPQWIIRSIDALAVWGALPVIALGAVAVAALSIRDHTLRPLLPDCAMGVLGVLMLQDVTGLLAR